MTSPATVPSCREGVVLGTCLGAHVEVLAGSSGVTIVAPEPVRCWPSTR
ncbi:MAG: hypothetical protein JWM62_855 [Frankiales bacterium]|nr:hypothetical protein [Frankiales bacterium]